MKPIPSFGSRLAVFAFLSLAARLPAQSVPFLIEPTAPAPSMRLIWQTEPGVRYDLFQSTDLLSWTHVPGYPAAAVGLSKEYSFNLGPSEWTFEVRSSGERKSRSEDQLLSD